MEADAIMADENNALNKKSPTGHISYEPSPEIIDEG